MHFQGPSTYLDNRKLNLYLSLSGFIIEAEDCALCAYYRYKGENIDANLLLYLFIFFPKMQ